MAEMRDVDFRMLAENSADIICRFGLDMRMHYVSPSSVKILGWTPEEIIAMPPFALVLPEDRSRLLQTIEEHRQGTAPVRAVVARNRRKDGSVVWLEINPQFIRDPATNEPVEAILVLRDITDRKRSEERLIALSSTDSLTGLANRRAFDEAVIREWDRMVGTRSQLSLLLLDIDHFKQFNDAYGHQLGDECLRSVAAVLLGNIVWDSSTVARYGGEEFAILLPFADDSLAKTAAERVRKAIESLSIPHVFRQAAGGVVTASIGVSTASAGDGRTVRLPAQLIASADHALYRAKHDGRNRIQSA